MRNKHQTASFFPCDPIEAWYEEAFFTSCEHKRKKYVNRSPEIENTDHRWSTREQKKKLEEEIR